MSARRSPLADRFRNDIGPPARLAQDEARHLGFLQTCGVVRPFANTTSAPRKRSILTVPLERSNGGGSQLERGIAELMMKIDADPGKMPPRPADPVKTR